MKPEEIENRDCNKCDYLVQNLGENQFDRNWCMADDEIFLRCCRIMGFVPDENETEPEMEREGNLKRRR